MIFSKASAGKKSKRNSKLLYFRTALASGPAPGLTRRSLMGKVVRVTQVSFLNGVRLKSSCHDDVKQDDFKYLFFFCINYRRC